MVNVFTDLDFSQTDVSINDELDLAFLEVIDQKEGFFAISDSYFKVLGEMAPAPAFVPTLHDSVFEEPLDHALWNTNAWPTPTRHFPA